MSARTELPPGPRAPRAVQTLAWGVRNGPWIERCQRRYGDIFTVSIAQEPKWVFVSHPDMVKQVFTGDPKVFHAGEGNQILLPVVGPRSVLLLDEGEHMRQRKLLLPPFHGERMQRYGELMTEIAEREFESWPAGEPLAMRPRMQAVTLEIIMRAVMGLEAGPRFERLRELLRNLLEATSLPIAMVAVALLGPRLVSSARLLRGVIDPVDEMIYEEIRARREASDLEEREDFLSMLLQARDEDGEPMGDQELRDELMTLLVAGHETTATSLAWAVERLVHHPGALRRLRDEVEAGEDEYLDAVVKETLRLRPVISIVVRRLTEPVEIGGYRLPAGAAVVPSIHLVHRRPDVYPDPRAFRPERFLEQPAGTYTWIPFGGGPRRCLGASFATFEMKRVLAAMMARVELRPTPHGPERVRRRQITMTPERGGQAVVAPRVPVAVEA